MTESDTVTDIQTLLQAGNAALLAGDAYEARQYFRRVTELAPDMAEAWVGLAGTVRPYSEKRDYLQQALQLDPANPEIQAGLAYVEAKLTAGEVLAPRGVSTQEPLSVPGSDARTSGSASSNSAENGHTHVPAETESGLRCIECGAPITNTKHVVWSAVGQLCADCARARRPLNYQVSTGNIAVAVAVSLFASSLISFLMLLFLPSFGFFSFLIAFIFAPMVAEFIVRILDRLTRAKRGRTMQVAVGASIGLGAAPLLILTFSLALLLFTIICVSTAVARLR